MLSKQLDDQWHLFQGTVKVTLAQPEKAGLRLLADFLNQYCALHKTLTDSLSSASTQQQSQQSQTTTIPNLQPIIKLYAYLLLGWRGEEQSGEGVDASVI